MLPVFNRIYLSQPPSEKDLYDFLLLFLIVFFLEGTPVLSVCAPTHIVTMPTSHIISCIASEIWTCVAVT